MIAGKASDHFGRVPILRISAIVLAGSLLVIGFATAPFWLMAGAVLYGIGYGMSSPSLFAWTIDLSLDKFRGKALASMYIALEVGVGTGAFFSGWLLNNQPGRFSYVFSLAASLALLSVVFLVSPWHKRLAPASV